MSEKNKTLVVVGGGIAGLSLAYHLHKLGFSYELYEKEERIGGICRSETIAGCIFDYAPRLFLLKDEYATQVTQELLGDNIHFLPFGDWSYHRKYDVYTRLPFQKHMYGMPLSAVARGIWGYIKTMLPLNGKEPQTYQDWLYHELGKPISDMLIIPQEFKKWKTHPSEMDHRWAPARVPRPDLKTLVQGALTDTSHERNFGYTIRGGIESLMKAFASKLNQEDIHTAAPLQRVDEEAHIAYFADGTQKHYQALLSTMPLPMLIGRMTNVPEDVQSATNKLKNISLKIACLVVKREKVSEKNFIYVHDLEYIFHRVSMLSNLSDEIAPPGYTSMVAEITYVNEPPMDDDALIERVIHDLIDMHLLRDDDEIVGKQILDLPLGYPMPSPDRIDNVKTIRSFLESKDIYTLGRYGEWEYINMHDIIPRARDLANRLETIYERLT